MLKKKVKTKKFREFFQVSEREREALIIFINCLNNVESKPLNFCKSKGLVVAEL